MTKTKKRCCYLLGIIIVTGINAIPALGASIVDTNASGYANGDYKLEDMRNYAIYIANLILGLVGSASLLAFVIGGFMFLISAGSQERIKQGKDIIKAAVIGIIITFSSVLIISLFLQGLGPKLENDTGKIITTSNP